MAEQHNAAGPPMLGASTSVSFDDPSTRAVEGVTIKISDEDPNGTVYPYYRADENKSARDWLQGILKDLPAQDEMSIYDIGLGMSRRILVKPGDLMSTLRIFERPAQSVKIEVQGVDINFAPTKKQRFTDALREKMDEWGEPDANLLAYARDSALAACPDGSSTALLDHVEQHFRGKMQKIHLDLTGDSGGACTEIRMGETIRVDVQCRDSLNTPATPTSDLEVNLQVVVSSFRGTQDTVELGMRTLRIADLAEESRWEGLPIFFLPKDQPSAAHPMKYALKVTHDGGEGRSLLGRSSEWTFLEEKKVEGKPEIEAAEVHKFHEDSQARSRPERTDRIATGGEAQIWNLLQSSDVVRELRPEWWEKVAKEAKEAGTTPGQAQTHTIREFLKDMCIWKRVSDKCGGKVAEFKGWYLSLPPDGASDPPYAGLRLKGYDKSLESELVKHPNAHECFELAIAVITTMCELNTAFPSLVFPDIKPSNFLVVSSVTGGRAAPRSVVLTDLGYAREEGAPVTLGSWPYQQCKRGEPSQHAFERFATLVTLLQIMLGMSSEDVLHWGTPTGTSLMDAINLLSDVRELKATAILRPEVEDGEIGKEILPNLKNIFHSLLGPTANIPSYDEIKSSLESVREQFRIWTSPAVTTAKDVMIGGVKVDRTAWQNECSITLKNYMDALDRGTEYDTFKGGYDGCRLKLLEHLGEIRTHVGESDGPMSRRQMLGTARDLAEALLTHLLRRKHWKGKKPTRECTPAEVGAVYTASGNWFHCRKSELWDDVRKPRGQTPAWLEDSDWEIRYAGSSSSTPNVNSSNIGRFLTMIGELYEIGKRYKHSKQDTLPVPPATPQEANNLMLKLNELFIRDDKRPKGKKHRILI